MLLGFLLVLLVLVCVAMSAVILMQRSEGGALGMGGSPSGILTVSGAGDLLTRTTSVLAAVFFVLCLALTIVQGRTHAGGSVVDKLSVKGLNAAALNAAMRPAAAPTSPSSAPAPQAVPSQPPPGAPQSSLAAPAPVTPSGASSFDAPAPQVHTTPVTPSRSSGQ
jgi:preprotein translocase subunit SecG